MTGIEALIKLKEGKSLRRNYWDDNIYCKAVDFFGEWIIFTPKEKIEITDEEFSKVMNSENLKIIPMKMDELFKSVGAGEFLHDDWELLNKENFE